MTANRDLVSRDLASRVRGPIFGPGDPGYAEEVAGFNTAVVHTPDVAVGALDAADVLVAVRAARAHGMHVSIQSTGHAETPIAAGMLISTRRLAGIVVDPESQTATIGGGARWEAVIAAAAPHGLFPIAGSSSHVGVTGYLLGGGLGPLARAYGVSSDYARGFAVVTGQGELLTADSEAHPDLFWALRGGIYGLGVVTETRLRLVPLRRLYAGSLLFAEDQIAPALRHWTGWTATADPRVTTSAAILNLPDIAAVPEPLRGRRVLGLRFAFPGDSEEGERLAAPLRAGAPIFHDDLKEMPAAEIDRVHDDPRDPGPAWTGGLLLSHVDQTFATAVLDLFGPGSVAPFLGVEIRQLGAATQRDVPGGSAAGGRAAAFVVGYVGANPELFATVLPAAADRVHQTLAPWRLPENAVNFMGAPRSAAHLASAWPPEIHARLVEVRRRYDPEGLFAHEPRNPAPGSPP